MKGFIVQKGRLGSYAFPVSHIKQVAMMKIGRENIYWRVQLEYFHKGEFTIWKFNTESEARKFYDYCLKQIAEWQDRDVSSMLEADWLARKAAACSLGLCEEDCPVECGVEYEDCVINMRKAARKAISENDNVGKP